MKKMATQFQCWKKRLYTEFVKKNLTPNFNAIGPYSKLRPYWNEFVEYKKSEEGEARALKNQQNARQKEYHHRTGSGGYKTAARKWEQMEADVIKNQRIPATQDWPERAKNWFFAHGGSLDLQTGGLVYGEQIQSVAQRLSDAISASACGAFKPNREKDELTYALQSAEHGGRTRGKGAVSWLHAYPQDRATYKSHQRRKDEESERLRMLEMAVLASQEQQKTNELRMQEEIKRQVQLAVSAQMQSSSVHISPSTVQMKSSCASTELANDAALRFPVDDITEPLTSCELHIPKDNATFMVAIGVVNPVDPSRTPRIHGQPIPTGYASVSVDRVTRGFSDVALDFPGGDGEKTLGEAEHSFILWHKRYIIIPGASPPPPPPHHRCGSSNK